MSDAKVELEQEPTGLYACLTIDDVAAGDGPRIRRLLDWLDQQALRATFFVIPFSASNQARLEEDADLVTALREAAGAGHEFQVHGHSHELFECGLPDLMAVHDDDLMVRIARTLSREEFQLRHTHTRGMIGARMSRSRKIVEEALGPIALPGFRSGYHEFCREMYFALAVCGYQWSSSRTAVPAAWRPAVTEEADEVVSWVGLLPYWVGDVLEIPHLADYGSHIAPDAIDSWVNLARRHLTICEEERAPFIWVGHQAGMSCGGDDESWRNAGYRAHEQVIRSARDDYGAEFVLMSDIARRALATPNYWPQRDEYRR